MTVIAPSIVADTVMDSFGVDIVEWQVPWESTVPRDPFAVNEQSVWFVGQGGGYLGQLDPSTGEFAKVKLKNGSAPHNVIVAADGGVWYAGDLLGVYNPASGKFEEWSMPQGERALPNDMTSDASGHIWIAVSGVQPNIFMGFHPATESFFAAMEILSGAGTIRHMYYHQSTGTVWFGTDATPLAGLSWSQLPRNNV